MRDEGGRAARSFPHPSSLIPHPSEDGNGEVQDFDLVVRRKGLTVDQLLGAGIPEAIARRAVGLSPLGR